MGNKYQLGVIDVETWRFKRGRVPKPFMAAFYAEGVYIRTEGDNCIAELVEAIDALSDRYVIYAHNGGKFDFHFFLAYIDNPVKIINGRIIKCRFGSIGSDNRHILQDSFAIIPAPLIASGEKMDVGDKEKFYAVFEPGIWRRHRAKIADYLYQDCEALYNWVARFIAEFGRQLTIGGTAMKQLLQHHDFRRMSPDADPIYREYYYGGRVECIEGGDLRGSFKVYDVNSMYPHVMKNFRHPINAEFHRTHKLPKAKNKTYFAEIDATSKGALPLRVDEGIAFPHGRHIFKACSHEIRMAQKHGLLTVHKVIKCYVAKMTTTFGEYVDHFYQKRMEYRAAGDKVGDTFAKFMLNSAYGKFGQDPENFKDWLISWEIGDMEPARNGYMPYSTCEHFELWERPALYTNSAYYDVSVAASITSAARATLLDGLQRATRPVYCDTDSIICEALDGDHDEKKLGAWKTELQSDRVVIAGKKLYALWGDVADKKTGEVKKGWQKVRSKGGTLTGADIVKVAAGELFTFKNPVPLFSAAFDQKFTNREFRRTARQFDKDGE